MPIKILARVPWKTFLNLITEMQVSLHFKVFGSLLPNRMATVNKTTYGNCNSASLYRIKVTMIIYNRLHAIEKKFQKIINLYLIPKN